MGSGHAASSGGTPKCHVIWEQLCPILSGGIRDLLKQHPDVGMHESMQFVIDALASNEKGNEWFTKYLPNTPKQFFEELEKLCSTNNDAIKYLWDRADDKDHFFSTLVTGLSGDTSHVKVDFERIDTIMFGCNSGIGSIVREHILRSLSIWEDHDTVNEIEDSHILKSINWFLIKSISSYLCNLDMHDDPRGLSNRKLLYADWKEGRSFTALTNSLVYYNGPTLLVIDTRHSKIITLINNEWLDNNGVYRSTPQKSDFGVGESFIATFMNKNSECVFNMMTCQTQKDTFYLNMSATSKPLGLGIGGSESNFRIFIDKRMLDSYVTLACTKYESGELLPDAEYKEKLDISSLEVWGIGNEESFLHQLKANNRVQEIKRLARKVDMRNFFDNDFDKEIIFGGNKQKEFSST